MISLLPLNQQKIRFHHDEIKTVIHFTKTYVLKCLNIKFQAELQDSKKKEAWKRKPFIDKLIVYCFRLVINVLITLLLGISLAAVYKVTEKMMEVCYRSVHVPHLISLICRKIPLHLRWKQGHLCSMGTFFLVIGFFIFCDSW